MKTFEQLKEQITPEIIKKLCELAGGFSINRETQNVEYRGISSYEYFYDTHRSIVTSWELFPLLLHRAVAGWNEKNNCMVHVIIKGNHIEYGTFDEKQSYYFNNYKPSHLTPCEMAIWDCLLEALK